MKNKNLLFIAFLFIFFSCSEDNTLEEEEISDANPWINRFYDGKHDINGVSFYTTEVQGTISNTSIDTSVCESEIPNSNFQTITLKIYVPKHPENGYQTGIVTLANNRMIITYGNNQKTDDVFKSGSIKFIGTITDPFDDSLQLSGFEIKAEVSNSYGINKSNFLYLDFPFYLSYLDDNGNEIYRDLRYFTLLNANC